MLTKTVYDPAKATRIGNSRLEKMVSRLRLQNSDKLLIWVEKEGTVLVTIEEQMKVAESIPVLLKLFMMRGKSILFQKLLDGASWIPRPTGLDVDTVFKGMASECSIKFQSVRRSEKGRELFVLRSRTHDLDEELVAA